MSAATYMTNPGRSGHADTLLWPSRESSSPCLLLEKEKTFALFGHFQIIRSAMFSQLHFNIMKPLALLFHCVQLHDSLAALPEIAYWIQRTQCCCCGVSPGLLQENYALQRSFYPFWYLFCHVIVALSM